MSTKQRQGIQKKNCPVCSRPTLYATNVAEDKEGEKCAIWYRCQCGVMFQEEPHEKMPKDKKYIASHMRLKERERISIHSAKTYSPIIEELTYGRKFLDVGYCTLDVINYMAQRGWVGYGIDMNKDADDNDRLIKDDFEITDKLYEKTYDLVWMSFVLEEFHDPVKAIMKASQVLQDNGVLYISTPDIDFIHSDFMRWNHWRKDERYIMWSKRSLCRELERLGFEVVMARRNFASRFGYDYDLHVIAQKVYF